jgi:hypothetical protein
MRQVRLDDAALEVRAASLDLLLHLAFVKARSLANELRYREDQPRAPRGTTEGGRWIDDTVHVAALCVGFSGGCQFGGTYGSSAVVNVRQDAMLGLRAQVPRN